MKIDVQKFMNDTNHSHLFREWNDNLHKMNKALGALPSFENGEYSWMLYIGKGRTIKIGFDEDGTLIVDFVCRKYKDDNKPVLNKEQTKDLIDCVLNAINIFDEFGFVIHPTEKGGNEE